VGQSVLVLAPSVGAHDQIFPFLARYENDLILKWGALSDERTSLSFALQSIFGPGHSGPITILCCLIRDWPSYTSRH
jgi:hypothetical protein